MAYALISLVQILEQDQHHLFLDSRCKLHIKYFLKEARVLKELLVAISSSGEVESLESRIREAVHKAEDMIEFHIMDLTLSSTSEDGGDSQLDLSDVLIEFEHIKNQMLKTENPAISDFLMNQFIEAGQNIGGIGYDINKLVRQAQYRWLEPDEILFILENYKKYQLTHQVPQKPTSGSFYLLNKRVVKDIRKDGYSWCRKRNRRTIVEAHERLKVGLKCYHTRGNVNFQKRSSWMLDPLYKQIVLIHYRDIREGKQSSGPTSFATAQTGSSCVIDGSHELYSHVRNAYGINNSNDLSFDQQELRLPIAQKRKFTIEEIPPDLCNSSKGAKLAGDTGDAYGIFVNDNSCGLTAASKSELGSAHDHNTAALSIQKKYRGWKQRKDFLTLRQKVVKTQAQTKKENSDIVYSSQDLSEIDDDSWKLLRSKVFGQDSFPPELQVLGKKIAKACIDLPLAINLIAAFLSSSKYTQGLWELVESEVSSIGAIDCIYFNILSVIYNHLPFHLKACFLYMGVFPPAVEIKSSRIIKLWNAEGFVEPTEYSFEKTAELYLEGLIGRNLLSVSRKELGGKVKAVEVDFHVNEFCLDKACEENFLWFKGSGENTILDDKERRVRLHPLSEPTNNTTSMSRARSFLCMGCASVRVALSFHTMRLLRVLDVFQLEFHRFPKEMLQLVLLRYLAVSCHSDLPSAISKFLNLQTLIIRRLPSSRAFTLPPGLWQLTQLRHVISKETCIWYYPRDKDVLQKNLQTLSNIHVFLLTNKFCGSIPNLTKLAIFCDSSLQTVIGLDCLQKLETLKCAASWSSVTRDFLSHLRFPPSLKKLTLSYCKLPCGFMTTVGSLPNLEHLKLQNSDFLGMGLESESEPVEPEWVPVEGEFLRLRSLLMKELNLVHWRAHANHFPCLQRLVIRDCCSMTEIPLDIGEIETLKVIEVDESSPSLLDSANQIKDERSLKYDFLQLHIWKS